MRFLLICFFLSTTVLAENRERLYEVNLARDLTITGLGFIAGTTPYLFSRHIINRRCPCPSDEVNGFDRNAIGNHSNIALTLTDVSLVGVILTPPAIDYFSAGALDQVFWEDALIYAQALAVTGALTSIVKHIVQRPLPRSYEGDPEYTGSDEGYRSFFSGHTSTAAAALAVTAVQLRWRYGMGQWTWALPLGLGTAMGVGRILAGVHFPSDVVVGLAVGTAIGTAIPMWHRVKPKNSSLLLFPPGLALFQYRF